MTCREEMSMLYRIEAPRHLYAYECSDTTIWYVEEIASVETEIVEIGPLHVVLAVGVYRTVFEGIEEE